MCKPRLLSKQIQNAAQSKHIGISPQIHLLIEGIRDIIESNIHDEDLNDNIDLTDITTNNTTYETNEEFHDLINTNRIAHVNEWESHHTIALFLEESPPVQMLLHKNGSVMLFDQ